MYKDKIVKRIPGDIPPPSKKEGQGYIDDLSNKQKWELQDLLERQNKLIARPLTSRLPDKGEKIKIFRDKIIKELSHRDEVEKAANLLSRLNIASEGKIAMNKLEWTGKYSETSEEIKTIELDSDDEEDPLMVLAQPTGSGVHKKKVIHLAPEESLITPEDLKELASHTEIGKEEELEHVKYILDKVEKSNSEQVGKKREPFKPYKTTKSNVHDPMKEKQRKKGSHWEITAATPPLIVHGAVKTLDLQESLKLQKEQAEKLQEVQAKHAAERLAEQLGLHSIGSLPSNIGKYRLPDAHSTSASSSDDEEEHEVHDEESPDVGGTVTYTVESVET
ncbi:DNA-directed RNA polymerase II subunit GRINL1A [Orussus abietinus]|uniref:DNA-directed RNA polymerase II subunit GRINL1A n=1 Tax=Orussus abietinus TaxID=222816 RepID=UPI00062647A9|nr:DNA-directed RNA polymerase II subunit GRINL1A [Orussus abietinus]XP_012277588.1 DNA-directed RNA polymerase II subunit GRINL1A [Orussus abietinus]